MDAIFRKAVEGKSRSALVVGGGFIGLEMAEALHPAWPESHRAGTCRPDYDSG